MNIALIVQNLSPQHQSELKILCKIQATALKKVDRGEKLCEGTVISMYVLLLGLVANISK